MKSDPSFGDDSSLNALRVRNRPFVGNDIFGPMNMVRLQHIHNTLSKQRITASIPAWLNDDGSYTAVMDSRVRESRAKSLGKDFSQEEAQQMFDRYFRNFFKGKQ